MRKQEEAKENVKSLWPLWAGLRMYYKGSFKKRRKRFGAKLLTTNQSTDCSSETRRHEVGIASNRKSARCGEFVLEFSTHRPSRSGNRFADRKGVEFKIIFKSESFFIVDLGLERSRNKVIVEESVVGECRNKKKIYKKQ